MNFTDSSFERMMRQRPGTDSGYLLHQCRKKFRSVLGNTVRPVPGADHP